MTNVEKFVGGFHLNTTDSPFLQKSDTSFHLEFLECLGYFTVRTRYEKISLKKYDIILATGFKKVNVISNKPSNISRFFQIDIDYPSPLNQFFVADNPLIHDLMNDVSNQYAFIVFRNLESQICHNYLNVLECLLARKKQDHYDRFQIQRVTGLLFTELLHDHHHKVAKSVSNFPKLAVKYRSRDTQAGAIMQYISSRNGQVSLQDTAQYFGYQKNYFSRLCHRLFNIDFVHLRMNIRITLAEEQLKLTVKSIEEISTELGYKDISNFTRTFTEIAGITPGKFRSTQGLKYAKEKVSRQDP